MTINIPMFQRILDQIEKSPEQHDQSTFEHSPNDPACGTTRCVAGWAIHFKAVDEGVVGKYLEESTRNLGYDGQSPEYAGQDILGLTYPQREHLFYDLNNDSALEQVRIYARGEVPYLNEEDY